MVRLQRSDLATEFSQLVQQEIKNHNDSILATNIALNEMRQQLFDLKQNSESKTSSLENACDIHLGAFGILKDRIDQVIFKMQSEINDQSRQTKANLLAMKKGFEDRESYYMTIDGFAEFNKKIDEWTANIQRSFMVQQDLIRQQTAKITDETKQAIEILRKTVQKSIDQEIQDRKEKDVTLDHFAINFAGMQREIEVLKKRCFIIEKNNENLYTQIDRLKAAK